MNEIYEKSLLLDFYGELLTKKQREICYLSMTEDWSLGEIAESLNISRQGVSDAIRRSEQILFETEEKLQMAQRFVHLMQSLDELEQKALKLKGGQELAHEIQHLKEEMLPKDRESSEEGN